jgi:regulator of RNase E activity RraA
MTTGDARIRSLDISDLERIERFRRSGYGGSISDALHELGADETILSPRFLALRQGMQLVGRALTVKLHSAVEPADAESIAARAARWEAAGGHPQERMMNAVAAAENGTVLCFDCGGDTQAAHFGEMSCQLAYAHGCRGMLLGGNCRDTQYILQMPDFPMYCFGTRPNAFGGWEIIELGQPIFLPGHLTHYVQITAGDFVFGDNDGVQIIPSHLVDEVLLRVDATFEKENEERQLLADGMSIDQVYERFGVL